MPRLARVVYPGAIYHVWMCGNRDGAICQAPRDRVVLTQHIGLVVLEFELELITYSVMTTHCHMVIATPKGNLPPAMHALNNRYAHWFNREYGYSGHVFARRYDAKIICDDAQLQTTCRYVDLNPVEAGLRDHPADWPWGGFRAVVDVEPLPPFQRPERLLATFHENVEIARRMYAEFVEAALVRSAAA